MFMLGIVFRFSCSYLYAQQATVRLKAVFPFFLYVAEHYCVSRHIKYWISVDVVGVRVYRVHISPILHINMSRCVLDSNGSGYRQSTDHCVLRNAHSVSIKGVELFLDLIAQMKLHVHCRVQIINLLNMYYSLVSYNLCSIGPDILFSIVFSIILNLNF